jgi:hypothetical protein
MSERKYEITTTSQALADVVKERKTQRQKGYDAAHDDQHDDGSLGLFAERLISATGRIDRSNWTHEARGHVIKKHDGNLRHMLVIAAALLIAEIERIDRLPSNG